jgi:lipopolysaccharide/colanic/teichoic acid biosynthesis glycosyltransferase
MTGNVAEAPREARFELSSADFESFNRAELLDVRIGVLTARYAGEPRRQDIPGVRWVLEAAAAAVLLVLLAPVFLAVALAIKLEDRGPVFFLQERTGRNARRFRVIKFRSMVTDAEARKEQLRGLSLSDGPAFKLRDDPRVTRVGRILRRFNLDELPQLLNVITGDMGFVGPRPTSADVDQYVPWHTARLEARPGITGRWQVSANANDQSFDDRVRLDIGYVTRRCVATDVAILLRTVRVLVGGRRV